VEAEKPVLVVNPRSGGGMSDRRWAALQAPLTDGLGGPFDVRFTECGGDGRRLAMEEASGGRKLVIALGGDGTISEVADGLLTAGRGTEMGIIPRGTGGDFRRVLGLPGKIEEAARHLRQAPVHLIDVGKLSFVGPDGAPASRHFVNIASFGFSAETAAKANLSHKRFGAKLAFLGALVRSLVSYENVEVNIAVDGAAPQRRTVMLGAVGNGTHFGGGMKICPDSKLDDGLFDLVVVGDFGKLELLGKLATVYEGKHLSLKDVHSARGRKIEVTPVEGSAPINVEVDGESPGRLPAVFEIVPRALRLRF
jgi:YegS/Rv2252/BmrU family lipid kinase